MKTIYLAGGCFWGLQKYMDQFDGIIRTEAGYANGKTSLPSYEEVCKGSGHAETVRVDYDEDVISLTEILERYFMVIDPVSVNRQGGDEGVQYRTGIYCTDSRQIHEARQMCRFVQEGYDKPLAVEVLPLVHFYPAESYHQKYLDQNPGGYCHIAPAMMHLEENEQTHRILEMESRLNACRRSMKQLSGVLDVFETALQDYDELSTYYSSALWMEDFEADEKGQLPAQLRRGVLSEDAVYDMMDDFRRLTERMIRLGADAVGMI